MDDVEVIQGHVADVGGFTVQRVLPHHGRRTVGSWCFVDLMGPGQVGAGHGLDIGPHPHIGLQTVTWLLQGEILHRDSVGSEQPIRPGQLNLMTAGHGVSHSEETTGVHAGPLQGVQLWVAQPEATRHGAPAFEHHAELPQLDLAGAVATVLVGEVGGTRSPARADTAHLGADLVLPGGRTIIPVETDHEHAVVPLDGTVALGGRALERGTLGYIGVGRAELVLEADGPARVLLLGGPPFPDELVMWWNYVGRTRAEVSTAHRDWTARDERFGTVASPLARIDVPGPPWGD